MAAAASAAASAAGASAAPTAAATGAAATARVLLIGVFLRDTLLDVHELTLDTKCRTTGRTVRPGGNCTNTAAALSTLSRSSSINEVRTFLHARLGAGGAGDVDFAMTAASAGGFSLLADMNSQTELSTCYCIRDKATGSRTIIRHGDASEPTVVSLKKALSAAVSQDNALRVSSNFTFTQRLSTVLTTRTTSLVPPRGTIAQ